MKLGWNYCGLQQSRRVLLAGKGRAQIWDAATGRISTLAGAAGEKGGGRVPLELRPYESKFVAIGAATRQSR
jgi:hypothetical protein